MPTYEYECKPEGHRFEAVQSFSDDALTACKVCGGPVRKLFNPAGIIFKGSGYYVTDSRAKARGNGERGGAGAEGKAAKTGADGAADGASSSKPAAAAGNGGSGEKPATKAADGPGKGKGSKPSKSESP